MDRVVGVDWGTSSFRAFSMDPHGTVEDHVSDDLGILRVPDSNFDAVLQSKLRPWLDRWPDALVVLSGMIGSRQGWVETPYLPTPAGIEDLAGALTPVTTADGRVVWVVPGVSCTGSVGVPDVMRGEETQIFGALDPSSAGRRLFVLPGTHSKWAVTVQGRIESFATYMTGELFAVLTTHSILGALMDGTEDHDSEAFKRGVDRARSAGGLLHHIFGVRTLGLFGDIPASGLRSYLSGLLIGHEILAASEAATFDGGVSVIGSERLTRLYAAALVKLGLEVTPLRGAVAAEGLWRIAAIKRRQEAPA